jgi:hypothetical protein
MSTATVDAWLVLAIASEVFGLALLLVLIVAVVAPLVMGDRR